MGLQLLVQIIRGAFLFVTLGIKWFLTRPAGKVASNHSSGSDWNNYIVLNWS